MNGASPLARPGSTAAYQTTAVVGASRAKAPSSPTWTRTVGFSNASRPNTRERSVVPVTWPRIGADGVEVRAARIVRGGRARDREVHRLDGQHGVLGRGLDRDRSRARKNPEG